MALSVRPPGSLLIEMFVRAVFTVLIVFRLADKKPVMDKLHFYVRRMDQEDESHQHRKHTRILVAICNP